jgi:glycerol-3-phosphate O-acyltransferase
MSATESFPEQYFIGRIEAIVRLYTNAGYTADEGMRQVRQAVQELNEKEKLLQQLTRSIEQQRQRRRCEEVGSELPNEKGPRANVSPFQNR